jgi:epoxyqueuosine reductase
MNSDDITDLIRRHALESGFDDCRFASVELEADDGFDQWLERGSHADMAWMERTRDIRQHVRLKVRDARSVIVLAKNHYRAGAAAFPEDAKIARYARARDYHRVLARPLKRLADYVRACVPGAECYASVDSGPVRERVWAARAGMGWIGRHGLVIHPRFGTWFHLATIITTAPLTPDMPVPFRCGSCCACVQACPTGAIVADRDVDARRCISYHTIENRGAIPDEIAAKMLGWVFGCDICQEACPWNRPGAIGIAPADEGVFPALDAARLLSLTEEEFKCLYAGTPVMRARHAGIVRNALQNTRGEKSGG